jgi:trehalose 6-phosphate synthase/phosphatase
VIAVRPSVVAKGASCQALPARDFDFVLALGDDKTDEDLFKVLPSRRIPSAWGLPTRTPVPTSPTRPRARELLEGLAPQVGAPGRQTAER